MAFGAVRSRLVAATAGALLGGAVGLTLGRRQAADSSRSNAPGAHVPVPPSAPAALPTDRPTNPLVRELLAVIPPTTRNAYTHRHSGLLELGLPSYDLENIHLRDGFIVCYDRRARTAHWVAEHLTKPLPGTTIALNEAGEPVVDRGNSDFQADLSVPGMFRARNSDYWNSGYDRGHLVPAGDIKSSQEALNQTFILSNVSPQVGKGFNRDYWGRFEKFCRSLISQFDDVYIVTGPLYLPSLDEAATRDATDKSKNGPKYSVNIRMLGHPPNVAIPTHFFKVVLCSRKVAIPRSIADNANPKAEPEYKTEYRVGSFIMPNDFIRADTPLTRFTAPIEAVESASGLLFFRKLRQPVFYDLAKVQRRENAVSYLNNAPKDKPSVLEAPQSDVEKSPTVIDKDGADTSTVAVESAVVSKDEPRSRRMIRPWQLARAPDAFTWGPHVVLPLCPVRSRNVVPSDGVDGASAELSSEDSGICVLPPADWWQYRKQSGSPRASGDGDSTSSPASHRPSGLRSDIMTPPLSQPRSSIVRHAEPHQPGVVRRQRRRSRQNQSDTRDETAIRSSL